MQKGLSVAHGARQSLVKACEAVGRMQREGGRVGKEGRLGEYQIEVRVGGLLRLAVGHPGRRSCCSLGPGAIPVAGIANHVCDSGQ